MVLEPIMQQKLPYIIHLVDYRNRKIPTNFSEEPKNIMAEPLQDRQIYFDYNIQVTAEMVCRSNEMLVCLADRYVVAENKSFIKKSLTSKLVSKGTFIL